MDNFSSYKSPLMLEFVAAMFDTGVYLEDHVT